MKQSKADRELLKDLDELERQKERAPLANALLEILLKIHNMLLSHRDAKSSAARIDIECRIAALNPEHEVPAEYALAVLRRVVEVTRDTPAGPAVVRGTALGIVVSSRANA